MKKATEIIEPFSQHIMRQPTKSLVRLGDTEGEEAHRRIRHVPQSDRFLLNEKTDVGAFDILKLGVRFFFPDRKCSAEHFRFSKSDRKIPNGVKVGWERKSSIPERLDNFYHPLPTTELNNR